MAFGGWALCLMRGFMRSSAIQRVYALHAREHWPVQALIALAGIAIAAIYQVVWPLAWAIVLVAADTWRLGRYRHAAEQPVLTKPAETFLAAVGFVCQSGYAAVPVWLITTDSHQAHLLGIIMLFGALLRQTNEFGVSRFVGLANWLPYVVYPVGLFAGMAVGAPTGEGAVYWGLVVAVIGVSIYCYVFWRARAAAEDSLLDARAMAEERSEAASIDAAVSKLMFQHTDLRAAVFDHDGRFLAMNAAWLRALGKTEAEVLGRTLLECTPSAPQEWHIAVAGALQGEGTECRGDRRQQPNGMSTVLDWKIGPWYRDDGTVGGAVAYAHDVTELHAARSAEAAKHERLELALKASRAFIWEVDYATQSLVFDDAAVQFFGETPTFDLFAAHDNPLIHPDDREVRKLQARAIAMNGGRGQMEHRHQLSDGTVKWVRSDITPAPDQPDGEMTRFVVLTRDVTEEMGLREELSTTMIRAEASLVEKRALLAELVGDSEPVPSEKATPEVSAAGTMAHLFAQLDRILNEIDARDLRLASAALQLRDARAAAEAASLAKSQFLANMSHELRTPLNAIIGYSEILIEDLDYEGRKESSADAERVRKSAMHLLALINDILDLSKIEAGRMEIACEPVNIEALMNDVADLMAPQAAASLNTVHIHIETDQTIAMSDVMRLRQALLNLMANAVKFTHEGRVDVTLRNAISPDGARWHEIEVADTGIGIASDALVRLFKPFSQADGSITRKHGGTGLGLALTREMVQAMGGDISVRSEPGEGSAFIIRLPARTQALLEGDRDGSALAGDQPHVLVIEDDRFSRALAVHAVESIGFGVAAAETGFAALEHLDRATPALVILDIELPDMSGMDVLAAIRGRAATRDVPVLVVSSHDDRRQSIAAGAQDHMVKPCPPAILAAAVARQIRTTADGHSAAADTTAPVTPLVRTSTTRRA